MPIFSEDKKVIDELAGDYADDLEEELIKELDKKTQEEIKMFDQED